jgi:hypothetical protein
MALPSSGGSYATIFGPGINPLAIRKGTITDVFFRDYHQSATNLADTTAGLGADGYFSPYALDGQVRTDLLITSSGANLGFYHAGSLGTDGIGYDPNTSSEDVSYAQSLRPARRDITGAAESFTITAMEQTPLIRYLANEMPLINVPDVGTANLTIPVPMEPTIVERQFILFGFDAGNLFARTIPRCSKIKASPFAWKREGKEGTGVKLDFAILPCPYVNKPVLEHYEGADWRALGGYALFSGAPVATSPVTGKVDVVFTAPTGKADPFTYKVYKTGISPVTARALATIDAGYPQVSGTTVTIRVLATATNQNKYDVEATGTNGLVTVSTLSNTITVT